MRLIDANVLIDKYGDWYTEEGTEEGYIGTIKGIVDSMPTIEPETEEEAYERGYTAGQMAQCKTERWIPVSERLSDEAQECWITAKDGTVWQGMFTRRYGERRDSGFICHGCGFAWLNAVAAWMPYELPEPYKENK